MAVSAVSSSLSSAAGASLRPEGKNSAIAQLRDEIAKVGKANNGRSKQEEEKTLAATSAAAGVGGAASLQNFNQGVAQAEKTNQIGGGANGRSGSIRPSQAKSVDQAVQSNISRGVAETSAKIQAARQDRVASEVQRAKNAFEVQAEKAQAELKELKAQEASQQLRSPANVIQVQRERQAEDLKATKQQNVEVQKVEQADPRKVLQKVNAEQVQRNQESSQIAKFKAIAAVEVKDEVNKNAEARLATIKGPSEVEKVRLRADQAAAKPQAVPPPAVGQNINIKA